MFCVFGCRGLNRALLSTCLVFGRRSVCFNRLWSCVGDVQGWYCRWVVLWLSCLVFFWHSENMNGNFDYLLNVPLEAVSTLVLSIVFRFPFLVIFPKVWPLETSGLSISQSLDGQDHSENYYCRFKQTRLERDECLRLQGCWTLILTTWAHWQKHADD